MIFGKFAKVIDNKDEKKLGRVKLKVLPEFQDVADSYLDWSYPYTLEGGGSVGGGEHNVPEIGEMVKVVIKDKYWKKIEYMSGDYIEDAYPYKDFSSDVTSSTVPELGSQTYPQPKYIKQFKDGSYYFHNSETGESGQFNTNGSYIIFDKDGSIYNYSKKDIKLYNDNCKIEVKSSGDTTIETSGALTLKDSGSISLNGNANSLVTYSALNTQLSLFWTLLKAALTAGNAGPYPVTFSLMSTVSLDISTAETTKAKVGAV